LWVNFVTQSVTEDIERELWDRGYLDFEDAEEFELALHHNYLPKLEDYGVLTHEPETGKVSYNPDDVFEQQVEEIRQLEDDYGGQSFISQSF